MKWIVAALLAVPLVLSFVPGIPPHGFHLAILAILPLFFWKYPAYRRQFGAIAVFLGLQTLAYPDPDMGLLGWILLFPWLWARDQESNAKWWRIAYLFGFLRAAAGFYWLGNIHWTAWFAVAATSGLAFVMAYELVVRTATFVPFALRGATAWVLFEWVHSWIGGGFPWLYLGHTQHDFPPVIQLAAVTGVPGISFVMAYAQHAVYARRELPVAGVLVAGMLVFGFVRNEEPEPGDRHVLLIQTALPQSLKESKFEEPEVILNRLARLSIEGLRDHPKTDLLVWAETMFPRPFLEDSKGERGGFMRLARQLARTFKVPAIYGVSSFLDRADLQRYRGFNSAVLVHADASFGGIYRKQWLVPMGEEFLPRRFLPESWCDAMMEFLFENVGYPRSSDLRKGEEYVTLDAGEGLRCAPSICFEGLSGGMTAEAARNADLVLNLTNNGWFGECWEERQMVAIWKFRAVETGVPFLSCANAGISCVIAPNGEATAVLDKIMERGMVAAPVPRAWERPLYGRGGRWILTGLLAILAMFFFLAKQRKKGPLKGDLSNPGSS
ncbi:MAG: apolipoprotein N-acyltransferase [Planctomycetota bacterium]|jgi:apolipoprotein N-acyltransferase